MSWGQWRGYECAMKSEILRFAAFVFLTGVLSGHAQLPWDDENFWEQFPSASENKELRWYEVKLSIKAEDAPIMDVQETLFVKYQAQHEVRVTPEIVISWLPVEKARIPRITCSLKDCPFGEILHSLALATYSNIETVGDTVVFNLGTDRRGRDSEAWWFLRFPKEFFANTGMPENAEAEAVLSWLQRRGVQFPDDLKIKYEKMGRDPARMVIFGAPAQEAELARALIELAVRGNIIAPSDRVKGKGMERK